MDKDKPNGCEARVVFYCGAIDWEGCQFYDEDDRGNCKFMAGEFCINREAQIDAEWGKR